MFHMKHFYCRSGFSRLCIPPHIKGCRPTKNTSGRSAFISHLPAPILFQIGQEDRDISRSDSGDPGGLSDGRGEKFFQFLARLISEAPHIIIINGGRNLFVLQFFKLLYLFFLPVDISLVPDIDLDLICDVF